METSDFPGCCTSAVIHSLGEHGEESVVTVDEINRLCAGKLRPAFGGELIEKTFFAISVNPDNIAILKEAGFEEIASYHGIQGMCHVLARGVL